jgi:subfamily B ATP-binding cassette protein HlyB/CyaB
MAVEPQMQRRWEEQLAGYVAASFRVLSLGNTASQVVQLISKIATAGILYFGAKLVIDGDLSVGELVAFNILAGRVNTPVLRLAQIWQDFHQARLSVSRLGDILNTAAEPTYTAGRARLPAIRVTLRRSRHRHRVDGREFLHDVSFDVPGRADGRCWALRLGRARSRPGSALRSEAGVLADGMDLAMADPAWLRRQIGAFLRKTCCSTARCARILRSPIRPCRWARRRGGGLAGARFHPRTEEGYDTVVGERGSTPPAASASGCHCPRSY